MLEQLKGQALNAAIKKLAPGIINNILKSFEALIDETASKHDVSPFLLHVLIEKQEKEVVALVCWEDMTLDTFSLMKMIEETFKQSFENVPVFLRPGLEKMMDGLSVNEIVLNHLDNCHLILRFNEDDELESYKVQGEQESLLNWMEFVTNVNIEL